jgi:hypothetical protein
LGLSDAVVVGVLSRETSETVACEIMDFGLTPDVVHTNLNASDKS